MVIGGCCPSVCSTALGTVDVMGYGLLARKPVKPVKRLVKRLRGKAG
ncbi:hypothetical protein GCM10010389_50660 [Streptomyces echinoruber]|uniref:Uncharacterized protein n=1 Tax=Streptomyces echinoruber TaxID=68898 RepID=A0A918RQJ6_9ACTN|nr:hypothetical protein GCM10010389_50660 [Streptomyces echinoruber]